MGKRSELQDAAARAVLVKDGPYGTAIQNARLSEDDYRGGYDLGFDQKGNNDLVNLTQPQVIADICNRYVDAGAHILATNTFNANAISQADYGAASLVGDINRAAARLTRECVDAAIARDGVPRFVAGAMGPTVWNTGCHSWYFHDGGTIDLCPLRPGATGRAHEGTGPLALPGGLSARCRWVRRAGAHGLASGPPAG